MKLRYTYSVIEEDDVSILEVLQFPEIAIELTTEEIRSGQVRRIAGDAIETALQSRIDYNDEIPTSIESEIKGSESYVTLSLLVQTKILLYIEFLKRKTTKSEFARSLGVSQTNVSRLFDLSHGSKFDVVLGAFRRLGLAVDADIKVRKI